MLLASDKSIFFKLIFGYAAKAVTYLLAVLTFSSRKREVGAEPHLLGVPPRHVTALRRNRLRPFARSCAMSSSEVVAPQSLDMSIKADESPKKLPEHPEAEDFEPVLKLDKLEEGLRHEDFSHDTEDREDHTFCGIMVVSARKCLLT